MACVLREWHMLYATLQCLRQQSWLSYSCLMFYIKDLFYTTSLCFTQLACFYATGLCFTQLTCVLHKWPVFYTTGLCFTHLACVLHIWPVFYATVPCFTQLSCVLHNCPVFYTAGLCCTQLSCVVHNCPVLYTAVLCFTQLSCVWHNWPVFYTAGQCFTQILCEHLCPIFRCTLVYHVASVGYKTRLTFTPSPSTEYRHHNKPSSVYTDRCHLTDDASPLSAATCKSLACDTLRSNCGGESAWWAPVTRHC